MEFNLRHCNLSQSHFIGGDGGGVEGGGRYGNNHLRLFGKIDISYVWIGKYKRIGEDGGGVRGGGKNGDKHLSISFYIFIWCFIDNSVT